MNVQESKQVQAEYAVFSLFQDIRDLTLSAQDPESREYVQQNIEDLIEAREAISGVIREVQNG